MNASRIKAARHSLWRAWVFGGLVWSTAFLGVGAALVWFIGARGAQTIQLALTLALVTCGGFYAFIYLGAVAAAILRRAGGRQPE